MLYNGRDFWYNTPRIVPAMLFKSNVVSTVLVLLSASLALASPGPSHIYCAYYSAFTFSGIT